MKEIFILSALISSLVVMNAFADTDHGSHGHDHHDSVADPSIGSPGDPGSVSRTIEITMVDNRFKPADITVKQGETIKFVLKNSGKKKHEMMIGTPEELDEHAKIMKKFPDMEHPNEPNMITIQPGKTGQLIWQFAEAGTVNFACPLPGHSKGMLGTINVEAK
ncbi:MAG: Blue (type 1) copper domain [Nitrosospira sp.]